jgi:hypothetical protein
MHLIIETDWPMILVECEQMVFNFKLLLKYFVLRRKVCYSSRWQFVLKNKIRNIILFWTNYYWKKQFILSK